MEVFILVVSFHCHPSPFQNILRHPKNFCLKELKYLKFILRPLTSSQNKRPRHIYLHVSNSSVLLDSWKVLSQYFPNSCRSWIKSSRKLNHILLMGVVQCSEDGIHIKTSQYMRECARGRTVTHISPIAMACFNLRSLSFRSHNISL